MHFKPAFGLANHHVQTIYSSLFRKLPNIRFTIETFHLNDGDFLEIYWSKIKNHTNTTPIVTLFHGLTGSYKSPYIQGVTEELNQNGFSVVLMHFRGCATQENLLPRSYHSGESGDAKEFIAHLHKTYPNSKLYGVGYSLGANMLLKLLGEQHSGCYLSKAVAISAPMQLDMCADFIDKGFSKFYQKLLVDDLNKSLDAKYDKHPMEEIIHLQRENIKKIKSFWDFDEAYTAPVHGFDSAQDYYTKSSAKQFLKDIRIPTLIVHALDDPFMPAEILPHQRELSSYISLEVSKHGGHVGFIGGTIFKPVYWTQNRIVKFFNS